MKNLFKKLAKAFSLVLVIAISFISLTACSNKSTVASDEIPETSTQISDSVDTKEPVAEEVTDKDEDVKPEKPETPVSTLSTDIFGIYKFTDKILSYEDIYYYDKNEVLTFFETRDINGVYDIIERLNFDEFTKNLTTYSNGSTERDIAFAIGGDIENQEYILMSVYYDVYERYFDYEDESKIYNDIIFTIENDTIITPENSLNLEFDSETNLLTAYFQFFYIDETSGEKIYTPLYIKTILETETNFESFTTLHNIDSLKFYVYKEGSAILNSNNTFTDTAKLAEILMLEKDEILDVISNCQLMFDEDKSHLIIAYEDVIVSSVKAQNENKYLIYNSIYVNVVNEQVDFTTNTTTLNFEIEIDENSSFTFSFTLVEYKFVEGIEG